VHVHQRWQLDFKMGIALQNDELVNLHTVCDPVGEVCLAAQIFPAGCVGSVPHKIKFAQVQGTLRNCFAQWKTLPQEIQTDGETDLVAERRTNDFPKPFTLWLKGLGIDHLVIRPGRPTDQAEVERCHRTINDYAIIGNERTDPPTLQTILNQAVIELALELPSQAPGCSGQPPGQAHPELLQPLRTFSPEWEWAIFDLQKVDQYLSELSWTRKVNKSGQVKIAAKRYDVGYDFAGQAVEVRFDPNDRHLVFSKLQQPDFELRRQPIKGLTKVDLLGLGHLQAGLFPQQLPLPLVEFSGGKGYVLKEQIGV
jgi:hypothetical protein